MASVLDVLTLSETTDVELTEKMWRRLLFEENGWRAFALRPEAAPLLAAVRAVGYSGVKKNARVRENILGVARAHPDVARRLFDVVLVDERDAGPLLEEVAERSALPNAVRSAVRRGAFVAGGAAIGAVYGMWEVTGDVDVFTRERGVELEAPALLAILNGTVLADARHAVQFVHSEKTCSDTILGFDADYCRAALALRGECVRLHETVGCILANEAGSACAGGGRVGIGGGWTEEQRERRTWKARAKGYAAPGPDGAPSAYRRMCAELCGGLRAPLHEALGGLILDLTELGEFRSVRALLPGSRVRLDCVGAGMYYS